MNCVLNDYEIELRYIKIKWLCLLFMIYEEYCSVLYKSNFVVIMVLECYIVRIILLVLFLVILMVYVFVGNWKKVICYIIYC